MQAKRLIPDSYLRWRHGRGFGIHSPFAYNFICLTLRERLPYYAYPALREELRRSGADMSHHDLGLIFRIVTRFMPESVAIFGDNNACVERTAVTAVSEHITFSPSAPFVIINGDFDPAARHLESLAGHSFIAIFPKGDDSSTSLLRRTLDTLDYGMSFRNRKGFTIITALPHLPRQDFDVRF